MILKDTQMKKIIIVTGILFCAINASGQKIAENILKARALTEAGKPGLAIGILNTAITTAKESRLYIERAEANIAEGNYSGAISDFNEANKLDPSSGEYGLAKIYALKGDASTSLYHLEAHLKSSFKKAEKVIMLDSAFRTIENRSEWRQFWKKEWYNLTEKGISEIEYYLSEGKIDESKEVLSEIRKNYPDDDDILYAESLINLSSGKYAEVIKTMTGLLASDPGNEKYLRVLANAQTGLPNPAGASVTYSQLIDSDVADAGLYILRAGCYKKTGETDKAIADINKYLEIYPDDRNANSIAGQLESLSGDNLKALEYFSRNLKLHPNDPQCYIDRGNSYLMSKSWDWAIKDYSMSLDLAPSNSDVWLNKGIALLNSGNVEDACHDFRKALSLGNKRAVDYVSNNCIK
mgnify:CR=1 FL=1